MRRKKGRAAKKIRDFLLENIPKHPSRVTNLAVEKFGVTRQAVNLHMKALIAEGRVGKKGSTRDRRYFLQNLFSETFTYPVGEVAEDRVWIQDIRPWIKGLNPNAESIWGYGVTEMVNNANEHSEGREIRIKVQGNAVGANVEISDDGVGIFRKIKEALDLDDDQHAVLELAKGKFTTDPDSHSGQGIFFTSRVFDRFEIHAGGIYFSHELEEEEDWILASSKNVRGTTIHLALLNQCTRKLKSLFDEYADPDVYGFTKTVVPVNLTEYGEENLISRSQAKRLLLRFEDFRVVILNFRGVKMIGQAFADEIFRVFPRAHPGVEITPIGINTAIKKMIERVKNQ
jgi:hypothetical protein